MKLFELLMEKRVKSSWIHSLEFDEDNNVVLMTLNTGSEYEVANIPALLYKQWIRARSKGKFWHKRIRGRFYAERVG